MERTFKPNFLAGKMAVITGGATGICYNIAQSYLKFGCSVCIMSRKQTNIDQAVAELSKVNKDLKVYGTTCDVRDYAAVEKAIDYFLQFFPKIDILINGAAGNFLAPFDGLSSKGFKTVIDIDLIGTFNVSKVVYEKSMKKHGGNIINISAYLHGVLMQIHAGSAKAGVDNITKTLAVELGPKNILNGIVPGAIEGTEGLSKLTPQDMKEQAKNFSNLVEFNPIDRLGKKEDISEAALFLASDAASYITGTNITVDGGALLTMPNFPVMSEQIRKVWRSKL